MSNRRFRSLSDVANHIEASITLQKLVVHAAFALALEGVAAKARAKIGHYQQASGSFPAWAELAERTRQDRVTKGFPEDEPLLRTGDLRDSIKSETDGNRGIVGSTSKIALYQEIGTAGGAHGGPIPPRSFLASTGAETAPEVVAAVSAALIKAHD